MKLFNTNVIGNVKLYHVIFNWLLFFVLFVYFTF